MDRYIKLDDSDFKSIPNPLTIIKKMIKVKNQNIIPNQMKDISGIKRKINQIQRESKNRDEYYRRVMAKILKR